MRRWRVSLSANRPPAEGGPHMVLVSTDEGVRYAAGDLLETTATQAAKVHTLLALRPLQNGHVKQDIFLKLCGSFEVVLG